MGWFTQDNVLTSFSSLATVRKFCHIGNDIWIIEDMGGHDYDIYKIDTDFKRRSCKEVEFTNLNPMGFEEYRLFGNRNFVISTTNDKIYMLRRKAQEPWGIRLLEFNTTTLELRNLRDFELEVFGLDLNNFKFLRNETINDFEYIISGDALFTISQYGDVRVISMSTSDVITTYQIPLDSELIQCTYDLYEICESNGSIFLVRTAFPAMRILYQYDMDNSTFIQFTEKVEIQWAKSMSNEDEGCVNSYVSARNNHIYQAVNCNNTKIVLDSFDVETKLWKTIFQYDFGPNFLSICKTRSLPYICANDMNAFIISDHHMELVVREVELSPKLEETCLYELAAIEAAKIYDFKSSTIELPEPLRERFAFLVAKKSQQMGLGLLKYHLDMIAKLEDEKKDKAILADGDPGLIRDVWSQLNQEQNSLKFDFERDVKLFEQRLKRRNRKRMRNNKEIQKNIDDQASQLEDLVQYYEERLRPRMAISSNYNLLIERYRGYQT